MLIYLIIYIPLLLCAHYDFHDTPAKTKIRILWTFVIVFTLFRGLRWEIGTDWPQFYYVYQHANWDNIFTFYRDNYSEKTMDVGYMFLNAFFKTSGFSYTVFLLVTNFWVMYCIKDFSERHTKYPILTFILLLNVGVPFPVRQTIAWATAIWSYRFIVQKKWIVFLVVSFCAGLIHKGTFISIPLMLVPLITERFRIKWQGYAGLYIMTFFIAASLGEYIKTMVLTLSAADSSLDAYATTYMNMDHTSVDFGGFNNTLMNGLSYTFIFAILLYIREKKSDICNKSILSFEFFFFLYALAAIIDNLIKQSDRSGMTEVLGRVTTNFDMLPLILPLLFVIVIPRLIKQKEWSFYLFFIYMCYKFWQQIPGSFYKFVYIPYQSIFDI